MIKKTRPFTANVHIFSNDRSKLPLWNTSTNTFVESIMTNNTIRVIAEDKRQARIKINAMVRELQSKVTLGHDKQATKYINVIVPS